LASSNFSGAGPEGGFASPLKRLWRIAGQWWRVGREELPPQARRGGLRRRHEGRLRGGYVEQVCGPSQRTAASKHREAFHRLSRGPGRAGRGCDRRHLPRGLNINMRPGSYHGGPWLRGSLRPPPSFPGPELGTHQAATHCFFLGFFAIIVGSKIFGHRSGHRDRRRDGPAWCLEIRGFMRLVTLSGPTSMDAPG